MNLIHRSLTWGLRSIAWLRHGRKYDSPVRPDRLLWLDPDQIKHKPANPPPKKRIPPTVIADGNWDQDLAPITEDVVYRSFFDRFVVGLSWEETDYVDFLTTDASEHGGITIDEALDRCAKLDALYSSIEKHGYRTQRELGREGELIEDLRVSRIRPPVYREVAVAITRDGEFVWHAGMHRLVIAKLQNLSEIPVRINVRHKKWQDRRERVYSDQFTATIEQHPDIEYLREGTRSRFSVQGL